MVGHRIEHSQRAGRTPRWFPAARERQAAVLERMADWVRGDDIDPELERLWQQADHEGLVKHLRRGHA